MKHLFLINPAAGKRGSTDSLTAHIHRLFTERGLEYEIALTEARGQAEHLARAAAEAGGKAMEGGSLTRFEKLCDDALTAYLAGAKSVPFGEHPLIGYLYARQAELTAIRIILTGRMAGLDTDTIRERLRESYV